MVFVDTLGKYMQITEQQTEKQERVVKEKGAFRKMEPTEKSGEN
jgi:hypothetical protein